MGVRNCFSAPSTSSCWLAPNFCHFRKKSELAGKYRIVSGEDVIEGPAFRKVYNCMVAVATALL